MRESAHERLLQVAFPALTTIDRAYGLFTAEGATDRERTTAVGEALHAFCLCLRRFVFLYPGIMRELRSGGQDEAPAHYGWSSGIDELVTEWATNIEVFLGTKHYEWPANESSLEADLHVYITGIGMAANASPPPDRVPHQISAARRNICAAAQAWADRAGEQAPAEVLHFGERWISTLRAATKNFVIFALVYVLPPAIATANDLDQFPQTVQHIHQEVKDIGETIQRSLPLRSGLDLP